MFNWEKGSVHTWNTRERLRPTGLYMTENLPENRLGKGGLGIHDQDNTHQCKKMDVTITILWCIDKGR